MQLNAQLSLKGSGNLFSGQISKWSISHQSSSEGVLNSIMDHDIKLIKPNKLLSHVGQFSAET